MNEPVREPDWAPWCCPSVWLLPLQHQNPSPPALGLYLILLWRQLPSGVHNGWSCPGVFSFVALLCTLQRLMGIPYSWGLGAFIPNRISCLWKTGNCSQFMHLLFNTRNSLQAEIWHRRNIVNLECPIKEARTLVMMRINKILRPSVELS